MKYYQNQEQVASRRNRHLFAIATCVTVVLGSLGCGAAKSSNSAASAPAFEAKSPMRSLAGVNGDIQSGLLTRRGGVNGRVLGGQDDHGIAVPATVTTPEVNAPLLKHRDVIRTMDLRVRVPSSEIAEKETNSMLLKIGGYVDSEEGSNLAGQTPTMTMHLRVPVGKFEDVIIGIEHLGVRLEKTIHATDVTQQLVDQDARTRTMLAEEESLRSMLRRANTLENTVMLEQKLTELRGEIESVQGQRKILGEQASLSTLNVTFEQGAAAAAPPSGDPQWFAQAWGQASSAGITAGRSLVIFSLWLLVFSPVAVVIYALGNKIRKAMKRAMVPPIAQSHAPEPPYLQ